MGKRKEVAFEEKVSLVEEYLAQIPQKECLKTAVSKES